MRKKRLCVFCGSSAGKDEKYQLMASYLGKLLVQEHIDLVYGGASIGLMGRLANSVLEEGGNVIGVIPQFMMEYELAHPNLTELVTVDSMHDRKFKMYDLADGFLALPGGPGTLDELFEVFTWAQLKLNHKAFGVFNFDHYFTFLLKQMEHMVEEGFLKNQDFKRLRVFSKIEELNDFFAHMLISER